MCALIRQHLPLSESLVGHTNRLMLIIINNASSIIIYVTHNSSALPVTFKHKMRNVLIEEGNIAAFRCELSKPGHSVEWRKRGDELLRNGEKYHMRQRDTLIELRIFDVMPEDSDIYTCICGNVETTATLTVNGNCLLLTVFQLWSTTFFCLLCRKS